MRSRMPSWVVGATAALCLSLPLGASAQAQLTAIRGGAIHAPELLEEAAAVRSLAEALDEEPDGERMRQLYLQNQARGNEVRQGLGADQMYHLDTVQ
jgi:hypothetical protein